MIARPNEIIVNTNTPCLIKNTKCKRFNLLDYCVNIGEDCPTCTVQEDCNKLQEYNNDHNIDLSIIKCFNIINIL